MIDDTDCRHIAEMFEQIHTQNLRDHEAANKHKHRTRRIVLLVIVVGSGLAFHKALEIPEFAAAAQSFDLIICALIEHAFNRVKPWD